MLMEIAQLCKSTYNNQLQQSICLSNMVREHTMTEPKLKVTPSCTLHLLTNVPTKCQTSTPYRIQEPGQDFITHGQYSKVKSRSHHDVAHLQPPTNVPIKYQLATPYGF